MYKTRHEAVKPRNRIKILVTSFCPIISRSLLRDEEEEEEEEDEELMFPFFLLVFGFLSVLIITYEQAKSHHWHYCFVFLFISIFVAKKDWFKKKYTSGWIVYCYYIVNYWDDIKLNSLYYRDGEKFVTVTGGKVCHW